MYTYIKKDAVCDMCGGPIGTACGHLMRAVHHITPNELPYNKIEVQSSLLVLCRDCLGHIQWYIKDHNIEGGLDDE